MKIFVQLICKNREEMDRAEYIISDILDSVQYDDAIDIGSFIEANDFGELKSKLSIKTEDKHAEK